MVKLRAVLFDLDDTLYSERDYVWSGFRAVSQWAQRRWAISQEVSYETLCQLFEAGARRDTFDQWLRRSGLEQRTCLEEILLVYRRHVPQIAAYPEVPGVLERLAHGVLIGLVSDGPVAIQERKLTALNLRHHFQCVVFTDVWGPAFRKPNPRGFKEALGALRVRPGAAAYVGDNPAKDFLGARQLGMLAVRVRTPEGLYAQLEPETPAETPNAEIQSLADLERCLAEIAVLSDEDG